MIDLTPRVLLRAAVGLLVLAGLVALVAFFARGPVESFASAMATRLGLPGVALTVLLADPIPGLGFQPVFFIGFTGGLSLPGLVFATWSGSALAGLLTYAVGRRFRGHARLLALLERWRVAGWLRAHGARAIAFAAVAPVPFGVATLGAGLLELPLTDLLIGVTFRIVKILATALALQLGWRGGA